MHEAIAEAKNRKGKNTILTQLRLKILQRGVVRLIEHACKIKHYPKETKGCYYERLEDCCWLCILRTLFTAIKLRFKKSEKEIAEKLERLADLHQHGILTDEEFYYQKEKFLKG